MMKKLISFALTLAMIFCMATTAFAVPIVGNHGRYDGQDNSYTDGELAGNAFTNNLPTTQVDIKVTTGEITHRYAVDVDFQAFTMTIGGGKQTWDVNKLQYVYTAAGSADATTSPTITVTNYSDLPVYVFANVEKVNANDGVVITPNGLDNNELGSAAPTGGAVTGSAKTLQFTLDVTLADGTTWTDVANTYASEMATSQDGTAKIATCVITVSNTNTAPST